MDEQALEIAGALLLWFVVLGLLSLYLVAAAGAPRARRRRRRQ